MWKTCERRRMHTQFWWENLRKEKQDLDINGRILLQVRKRVQSTVLSEISLYYCPVCYILKYLPGICPVF